MRWFYDAFDPIGTSLLFPLLGTRYAWKVTRTVNQEFYGVLKSMIPFPPEGKRDRVERAIIEIAEDLLILYLRELSPFFRGEYAIFTQMIVKFGSAFLIKERYSFSVKRFGYTCIV